MSDTAPAEQAAIHELDELVRHLADELAGFRRRALVAEARLKELEAHEGGAASLDLIARVSQLEKQNERLQSKLDAAGTRAKQMLDRVKFLRQQAQGGGER
ncbi:MAG: hypothetical protein ABJF01_13815 [bacterium]